MKEKVLKVKKMIIFEPAMCCSTGLCGAVINPELLRISTVSSNLEKIGIKVERYNLSNNPNKFIEYKMINELINENGINILPITVINDVVMKTGAYPTNEELIKWLDIEKITMDVKQKNNKCNCKGGCC